MKDEKQAKKRWRISRRGLLVGTGALGAGLALGYAFGVPAARLKLAEVLDGAVQPTGLSQDPKLWLAVAPDNTVTLNMPKIEMGQGVHTALAQLVAEELDVDWRNIRVVPANTGGGLIDTGATGGSSTVSSLWQILREVSATTRAMLTAEAAKQLGGAVTLISPGVFAGASGTPGFTYGDVVAKHSGDWVVPAGKPVLKSPSEFKVIGQSMPRVDFLDKLQGKAVYGYDARLPGMLYGAVARPPTIGGVLKRAASGAAAASPGVVKVVIDGGFVGVVAESRQQAIAALGALDIEWDEGKLWQQDEIDALLTVQDEAGIVIQQEGRTAAMLGGQGGRIIEARYRTPLAVHAQLEPQAALVDVQPGKVRGWVATQAPGTTRGNIAKAIGRAEADVDLTPTHLGGGFGRRLGTAGLSSGTPWVSDPAIEAAILSAAVGKPVHVGWTRKEEFQHGYLRPPTQHHLRAVLGPDGALAALDHQQASGEVAFPFLPSIFRSVLGADLGSWRGARLHYTGVPNRRTQAQLVQLPVRTGWWRGLGLLANTFAIETFIDECAAAAQADPLAFRLRHFGDDEGGRRFKAVLRAAADAAGWGAAAPTGRARGIACSTDVNTMVAQVAEVSVENNAIRVHKVTCAIDPGFVINPDGVRAQVEGAIVMGLSSALIEAASIKDGRVGADNFDGYPLITMRDAPEIETVLAPSGGGPYGMGEPPIGPIAAAVGNAIFALTGRRLRELPLRLAAA